MLAVTGSGPLNRSSPELLDCQRIRHLRLLRGYSVRRVARHLGVSAVTMANLEDGVNHADLPMRMVAELARVLGVAPIELFARARDRPAAPAPDDRAVETALMIRRSSTSTSDLADALAWDLARVRRALARLEERQRNSGIRLHSHGWQCHSLRPATEYLSDEQQQAVHCIGPVQRGLNVEAAALLAEVAAGTLKQGLVVALPGGALEITPTVRFGFFPDETSELS